MNFNIIKKQAINILARTLDEIKKNIVVDLQDLRIDTTQHSEEQKHRDDNFGMRTITDEEITHTIDLAISQIIDDFANGEINNHKTLLIQNKDTFLNVVCILNMNKGPDSLRVLTVMRKEKFVPNSDTEKVYQV